MEDTTFRKRATVTAARSAGASIGVRTAGEEYSSASTSETVNVLETTCASRRSTEKMSVVLNGTAAKALVSVGGGLISLLTSPSVEPGDDEGNGVDVGVDDGLGSLTGL
jgi:hypothetical protein